MANILRGAFGFPLAGDGAYLRFDNNALAQVEAEYGVEWWANVMNALDRGHQNEAAPAVMVLFLLKRGLHVPDGTELATAAAANSVQPLWECCRPLQEALCLAVSGLTYDAFLKKIEAKTADLEKAIADAEAANPQNPAASSASSGAAPSGQD